MVALVTEPAASAPSELATASPESRVLLLANIRLSNVPRLYRIPVQSCRRGEQLTAVQLRVTGNVAYVDRLQVIYGNGQRQELRVRSRFNANGVSRWIDLGARRFRDGTCVSQLLVQAQSGAPGFGPIRFGPAPSLHVYGQTYAIDRPGRDDRDGRR